MKKYLVQFFALAGLVLTISTEVFAANAPSATLPPPIQNQGVIVPPRPSHAQILIRRITGNDNVFAEQKQRSETLLLQILKITGIRPGIVLASPSQNSPNYFFHWVRDAAVGFMGIQHFYLTDGGASRGPLQNWMLEHLNVNLAFQAMPNLIAGLGEPKFNFDGSAFQGPWGRPQTDGPALRSISFIYFVNRILKDNWPNQSKILAKLYDATTPSHSLIKTDLEYIAHNWRISSFDLWEESYGAHFFTLMVQRRAMIEGSKLAQKLGDPGAAQYYMQQANQIAQTLQAFWNPGVNYVMSSINVQSGPRKPSLIDSSVLLAALYGDIGDGYYAPYDDRVLASLQAMREVFQKIYPINQNPNFGIALGRYPEDTYDGVKTNSVGNPWFIASHSAAEIYYRNSLHLTQVKRLQINSINLRFFNSLMMGQMVFKPGQVIVASDPAFQAIVRQLFAEGDRELELTIMRRGSDGSISEQMNRGTGRMQGAVNLTWSHSSFLSAIAWRNYVRPSM